MPGRPELPLPLKPARLGVETEHVQAVLPGAAGASDHDAAAGHDRARWSPAGQGDLPGDVCVLVHRLRKTGFVGDTVVLRAAEMQPIAAREKANGQNRQRHVNCRCSHALKSWRSSLPIRRKDGRSVGVTYTKLKFPLTSPLLGLCVLADLAQDHVSATLDHRAADKLIHRRTG